MSKKSDNISHGKPSAGLNPLKASQPSDSAKIRTDVEETKSRLTALAEKWKGVNSVYGFLTDLWQALGIAIPGATQQKGGNPSRYAAFDIGNGLVVTVRASAHNADAGNYTKDGNVHGDSNLSIVLQKRNRRNTFKPNDEVNLEEYVYVESRIASVENPLSQIALSLVNYLTDGNYVDTTGVAIPHKSPITESKTNKNMKKNVIKINENTLKQIVVDSVKKVLKESAFRGLDDDGKPTHYATQDDDEIDIDYAMEQCAKAAMEFILKKESQMGNEWFNEFSEKCSHDGMFNSLDEKQLKECYIKGNKASHSCVYKGNGVQLGRIPTHYGGEWQD